MLIVLEGPDNAGKSTISEELHHRIGNSVLLNFPGRDIPGTVGSVVYDIHHNLEKYGIGEIDPLAKQALHFASHIDLIRRYINPALNNGQTVILDRSWVSMFVYGTLGKFVGYPTIHALTEMVSIELNVIVGTPMYFLIDRYGCDPDLKLAYERYFSSLQSSVWKYVGNNGDLNDSIEHILNSIVAVKAV